MEWEQHDRTKGCLEPLKRKMREYTAAGDRDLLCTSCGALTTPIVENPPSMTIHARVVPPYQVAYLHHI